MNKRQKLAAIDAAIVGVLSSPEWLDDSHYSCHAIDVACGLAGGDNGELCREYADMMASTQFHSKPYLSASDVDDAATCIGMDTQDYRANMLAMFRGYIEAME